MRRSIVPAILILVFLTAACAKPGAEGPGEVRPLSPDTLQAWINEGRSLVLLDTRPDSLYREARIGGAVPSFGRTIPDLREVLPLDHVTPVVFYNSDGSAPVAGLDPAREAAERYGFPLVYRLEGGLEAWIARGFAVAGLRPVSPAN